MQRVVLAGRAVDVAWVDLGKEPLRNDWLDDAEHARAQRFIKSDLRDRFVAAHCALRRILSTKLYEPPHQINIVRDSFGKPQLGDHPALQFNLSHSEHYALIALADVAVGVDVEHLIAAPTEALASEVLHPVEFAHWKSLDPAQRRTRLTEQWTTKEAALKAAATGLRVSPASFEIASPMHICFETVRFQVAWCPLVAPEEYAAALAVAEAA